MIHQALTLLLIEDDEQCARMVQKVLPQYGYAVHHARTGLPDLDGKIVVNQLRGFISYQSSAIIAFTAEAGARAKRLALAFSCDGFISKPIDTRELHSQITHILQLAKTEGNKS